MAKNRITVKDIAQRAGVSRGTVDRVLHNRGDVAKHVIDKVNQVVDELGYKPNLAARSLARQKAFRIVAILPKGKADGYWHLSETGIQEALEEISNLGIDLEHNYFETSNQASFEQATASALSSKPDAILIAAEFYAASVSFFERAEQLKVPVLCINTQISECSNLGYIGPDAFQCGIIAASLFERTIPNLKNLLILNVGAKAIDQKHLLHKEQGFRYHFDQSSLNVRIDEQDVQAYKDPIALGNFIKQRLIELSPQGIFVTNSRAHYLVPALESLLISDISIIGFDLTPPNIQYLNQGKIDFLIHQNPKLQGALGVRALFQFLMNQQNPAQIEYVPLDVVMKENSHYYLK